MIRNILTTTLAAVLSLSAVGAHAQTKQVAFIGDYTTYQWGQQPQFTAHTNWLPDGVNPPTKRGVQATLNELQTIIKSGKQPIIHLMVGTDSYLASPGDPHSAIFAAWAQGFEQIITAAQAAKLTILVGTNPLSGPLMMKAMSTNGSFCTARNTMSRSSTTTSPSIAEPDSQPAATGQHQHPRCPCTTCSRRTSEYPTLSPQAWSLMSDMAQTAIIQAEGYKLKGGYLQTVVYGGNSITDFKDYSTANANTVFDGGYVQFTPYGQYTDGSTHIMNNADINGHVGTWNSSSPTVVVIDQYGAGRGMDQGQHECLLHHPVRGDAQRVGHVHRLFMIFVQLH